MKKAKLFTKDISPACGHCLHGSPAPDERQVLCPKKGVMLADSNCKHYEYDPLKRKPKTPPPLPRFSEEEFRL